MEKEPSGREKRKILAKFVLMLVGVTIFVSAIAGIVGMVVLGLQ